MTKTITAAIEAAERYAASFGQAGLHQTEVSSSVGSVSAAMEVDVVEVHNTSRPAAKLARLTEAERDALRASGSCFKCRQPGHLARDCGVRRR